MARSILIVDDDHDVVHVLAELLALEGYRVRCAFDGQAALWEVDRDPPDLVLTDVVLPQVDGMSLARQFRARGWAIPLVLMSAAYAYVDLPGLPFVPKPFDLDVLLQVIAHAFGDRQA